MLYTKPTHWLIPTLLIGEVVRSLIQTLNIVTTRNAVVNSAKNYRIYLFHQTIYTYMKNFRATGSILATQKTRANLPETGCKG
jgi:hypothetical protein